MKKRIVVILACVLATFTLTACSLGECWYCEEFGIVHKEESIGGLRNVCDDCAQRSSLLDGLF